MRTVLAAALLALVMTAVPCLAQPVDEDGGQAQPSTPVKAKSGRFSLECPAGWQSRQYAKLEEASNAKIIMQGGLMKTLGEDPVVSDNINLWWSPQGEAAWFLGGIASLHRIETKTNMDMVKVLENFNSGKLPAGVQAQPAQLGQYVGILGGGLLQQPPLYIAAALVSQGKSTYVATLIGPQQAVAPQWPNFMKILTTLKAEDLKPAKLEDFYKPLEPEADEDAEDDGEAGKRDDEGEKKEQGDEKDEAAG